MDEWIAAILANIRRLEFGKHKGNTMRCDMTKARIAENESRLELATKAGKTKTRTRKSAENPKSKLAPDGAGTAEQSAQQCLLPSQI